MELIHSIEAGSFKTQPFLPSEEEADKANEQALEQGIPADVCVVVVANQTSVDPVKVPTEDPKVSFMAKAVGADDTEEGTPTIRPLQLQENDQPLIAAPLALCAKMGVQQLVVVLPQGEKHASAVRAAVDEALQETEGPTCTYVSVDESAGVVDTALGANAAKVEIFGFDAPLLSTLLSAAEACNARSVLALDACAPRIQPRHIAQLFSDAQAKPNAEIVTSWSAWARHFPYLFSVELLQKLRAVDWCYTSCEEREQAVANSGAAKGKKAGQGAASTGNVLRANASVCAAPTTPLLNLQVKDSVFGEERLDVSGATPAAFQKFAANLNISALQAVTLAEKLEGCKTDEEYDALTEDLSDADKHLLEAAQTVRSLGTRLSDFGGFNEPLFSEEGEYGEDEDENEDEYYDELDRLLDFYCGRDEEIEGEELDSEVDRDCWLTPEDGLSWVAKWGARNKADFPIFAHRSRRDSFVYLDTAATSQRCYQAIRAEQEFQESENANVYRGAYDLSMQATFHMNDARAVIENWINSDRRQTVITANASASLNLVAQAWGEKNIGEGDLIVVPMCEHHSNLLPWMMLAARKHARIGYIPVLANGTLDLHAYQELLVQKPKLVCVAHIGNVFGIPNPVQEMAQAAHEVGARFVLDAAQSFPHVKLDVKELGADFVAFSAHKAYGPNGIGGLWISPDAAAEMEPLAGGGGTVSHVGLDSYYWRAGAIQYELGTPQLSQLFGFAAAVEYLQTLGMQSVDLHSAMLTEYLIGLCKKMGFVRVWGSHDTFANQTGLVSLSVAGIDSSVAGGMLGKMGVAVRSGAHCAHPLAAAMGLTGTIRISFGVYNTPNDVLAACAALVVAHDLGQQEK